MKRVAIITMNGNDNYGNKLQNLALQKKIESFSINVMTIRFLYYKKTEYILKNLYKYILRKRFRSFYKFDKNIKYYHKNVYYKNGKYVDKSIQNDFDYFIVGSDQVWNSSITTFDTFFLLDFVDDYNKKNSYAASFGIDNLPNIDKEKFKKYLNCFSNISVREDRGKNIIKEILPEKNVEVLIDPTMLLDKSDWIKYEKKPRKLKSNKFILNYFLGNISEKRSEIINKYAQDNNCDVINILDKNSIFYNCGPGEFLYLINNAYIIFTDSFHACVFSILFNKPFVVFDREQNNILNTNSRIETLIDKFKLENRKFNGLCITKENFQHNYSSTYDILCAERKKSDVFLKKALNIRDCD